MSIKWRTMCPFKCLKESIQVRFYGKLTGPFLRSVVKQKYIDATYKIRHILRNVYATNMIFVSF